MHVIQARNINDAVAQAVPYLLNHGIEEQSRNGSVIVAPGPVCTIYENPTERVLFSKTRDANPFFHLMESLWMLDGRNDIAWPVRFNAKFINYSDDGKTQFGAYGWRWREFFGYDQIQKICEELMKNPDSRRCVLSMWNGMQGEDCDADQFSCGDLIIGMTGGKDVPCNTHAYFDCRGGKLNMTVCNRSNDIIWGAYGANVVHFSMLQEYMAACINVPLGVYRQMSNNFHAYTDIYDREKLLQISEDAVVTDLYNTDTHLKHIPLVGSDQTDVQFMKALQLFLDEKTSDGTNFFTQVALPMYFAWEAYREKNWQDVWNSLNQMPYCDWSVASHAWMVRRERKAHNVAA